MGLFNTWKKVMFDPMNFFEKLPDKIKLKEPSFFYIKINAIMLLGLALLILFFGTFFLAMLSASEPLAGIFGGIGFSIIIVIGLILFPVMLLFSWGMLFVGAGITHLLVLLFGGTKGFHETYKTLAYASAPNILGFIPYLNWITGIYILVLQVIGIHKRQDLSIGKSIAVVLIPFLAILLFIFFSMVAMFITMVPGI